MRRPQYSPSRLQVFQTCTRQYHFQYVQKLPRRAWANQSFGISLHRTLQAVHEQGGPKEQTLDQAQAALTASWSSAGYDTREQEKQEQERARQLLAAYYETWSGDDGVPVLLEKRMTAPYKDVTLLGIVDRVDRMPDGTLAIIDYKSGRAPEQVRPATVQQLGIYHHLITEKLGEVPQHHVVHYLASNVRLHVPFTPPDVTAVLDHVHETVQRIEQETRFQPETGEHCGWCDYLGSCPTGRTFLREAAKQP